MPLAVVTGASGFVGSHLVEHLLAHEFSVRCMLRETSSTRWLSKTAVEITRGSLDDPTYLQESVRGADYVFHIAGAVWAPNEDAYIRANAEGPARLAEAVMTAAPRVKRVVLISSLAAAGPAQPGHPRTEQDPERPTSPYGRSKLGGERETLKALGEKATVLRPPAVFGPRDLGFLKLFRLVKRGFVPRVGRKDQEVTLIYVGDLVRSILSAALHERTKGEIYFVCDPRLTNFEEVGKIAAEALGRKYRTLPIPNPFLVPVSKCLQMILPALGKPNPFPPDRVRDLLQPAWSCSPRKAQRDFAFDTRVSHETGISEAILWSERQGWL